MSEKFNATCSICGKPYKICRTCQEMKSFTPWRTVTDTLQHYAIFLALSEYTKTKDKEKAKNELATCDLSELDTFNENIKNMILDITKEEVMVEEPQIEKPQIDENNDENVIPQKFMRKNNSRKKYEVTDDDIE